MVHGYFDKLKAAQETLKKDKKDYFFDLDKVKKNDIYIDPGDNLRWAYPFRLVLPLEKKITYDPSLKNSNRR